ncbi:2-oxoacid:acceptor oxidoreductase family protein [Dendrosporobacter sp. 1207_IL3150]|uniref:2-oxoacid:acceptor oxidoreductase family protein n=1 Tax=Dendrosporobacter sp. 1207_IL3150 TaxID=3084054 RepID=UPI002FD976A3
MSKVIKIALAGEGGQGVQSIAEILAEAANEEGKNALYIPNFGVEQRGGVSIAYVQISDGPIGAPKFVKADILIPLSPRAVNRTKDHAGPETVYIYDNSLIQQSEVNDNIVGLQYFDVTPPCPTADHPNQDLSQDLIAGEPKTCSFTTKSKGVDPADIPEVKRVIAIPANDIAKNELHPRVFNVIILGAIIAATSVLPLDSIKNALEVKLGDKFTANPKLREMNFKALERGYELIKGAM